MEGSNKEYIETKREGIAQPAESFEAIASVEGLLAVITPTQRELVDYTLNKIGETERSLELADDQEQVVAVLKKIVQREKSTDAARIAKEELEALL